MATIRKRNSKYHVQIRRVGHTPITRTFHLRKDAMEWARQMELRIDRRDLPQGIKNLDHLTLGSLVARYREEITPTKKTKDAEALVLGAFLRHPICRKTLGQLTLGDFVAYRDQRLKQIKPSSLRRSLVPIRHMFEVARDEWALPIKENPIKRLNIPGHDVHRERRLRPGELDALLTATEGGQNDYLRPLILLALATGMRRGELLGIKRQHVDFRRRAITIPKTKNGHSRTIPLTRQAAVVLEEVRPHGDLFFAASPNAVRLSWEHLRARAHISDLRFHDLRHEAISRFFELGLSITEVAHISGHRDYRMLFRYSHAIRQTILSKLDRETTLKNEF